MIIQIYNAKLDEKQKIYNFLKKQTKELDNIFDAEIDKIVIRLFIDKKEMEKIVGRNLADWEVAIAKKGEILMLNPKNNSSEHYNEEIFWQILLHETVHIYYHRIIPRGVPYWLNEGLCYFIAKQKYKEIKSQKDMFKALDYFDKFDEKLYYYGPNLTKFLIKKYGIKEVINLIKDFRKTDLTKESFDKIIKKLLKKC